MDEGIRPHISPLVAPAAGHVPFERPQPTEGTTTSLIIKLSRQKYLIEENIMIEMPEEERHIPRLNNHSGWKPTPVTLVRVPNHVRILNASTILQDYLEPYLASDDVLTTDFFSTVIFCIDEGIVPFIVTSLPPEVKQYRFFHTDLDLRGPYVVIGDSLHMVYKLYPDPYGAFVCGLLRDLNIEKDISHRYVEAPTADIPVQSRLYFPDIPPPSKPLMGTRVAVKDIYDIKGVKTGAGSRSYLSLQEPATSTAHAIDKLINLGAIIIGKTKNTNMVSGASPRDWVDYQCPFNPRGYGNLSPDCSSSGSAAAIAAYDWLDVSVGSDSLGSMVGPASACGVYGLRPTLRILSNQGAVPVSAHLDTPGHFCRDVEIFSRFWKYWASGPKARVLPFIAPTKIYTLTGKFSFLDPARDANELSAMDRFLKDLVKWGGPSSTVLDIEWLWEATNFKQRTSASLEEYLCTTLATIQLHDSYHNSQTFRDKYLERFGRQPPVDPLVGFKWDLGSKITAQDYEEALRRLSVFQEFLYEEVLKSGHLILLPGGMPTLQTRDNYPLVGDLETSGKPWQGYGFTSTAFSSLGGVPCVSFPVDDTPYLTSPTSTFPIAETHHKPTSMWMLGGAGTDTWLLDLISYYTGLMKRQKRVATGQRMYPTGVHDLLELELQKVRDDIQAM